MSSRTFMFLLLIAAVVAPFMLLGLHATRGMHPGARLASTLVPPAVTLGTVVTYFVLAICKTFDTLPSSERAACSAASTLAEPVALAYFATVLAGWAIGLGLSRRASRRKAWIGVALLTACIAPILTLVALWAAFSVNSL